ncbi:MAG: type II secretion system major pseudopilin GspG [Planctomycetes bacterium]|nr:type II secretion system major pseudopilin GspG [Planctomycetota bacterium]
MIAKQGRINTRTYARMHPHRAGFTMVEAVVMIIIIGVLAGLVGLRLFGRVGEARQSVAQQKAAVLRSAVSLFRADCSTLQNTDTLEQILWEKPTDDRGEKWKGPYIEKRSAIEDPWGEDFIIRIPGEKSPDFDIISYGADKKPGGEEEDADIIE